MDPFKAVGDLLAALPIGSIAKEKAELLKTQVEAAERVVRQCQQDLARAVTENEELKAEIANLKEMLAGAILDEKFEQRGAFLYKKGDPNRRCPNCKIQLAQRSRYYICTKCRWGHQGD